MDPDPEAGPGPEKKRVPKNGPAGKTKPQRLKTFTFVFHVI